MSTKKPKQTMSGETLPESEDLRAQWSLAIMYRIVEISNWLYLRYVRTILYPVATFMLWCSRLWKTPNDHPRITNTEKVPHILFIVESNGNGHFIQLNQLLKMHSIVSKGSIVSIAWDRAHRPNPMIDRSRFAHEWDLSTLRLNYDTHGHLSTFGNIFQVFCNHVHNLRLMYSFLILMGRIRHHKVTKIINLFHGPFSLFLNIVDPGVPTYNVGTQYVHIDHMTKKLFLRGGSIHSLNEFIQYFALCSCLQITMVPGVHIIDITPCIAQQHDENISLESCNSISFPPSCMIRELELSSCPVACSKLANNFILVYFLNPQQSIHTC